jgi:hypothetical protein
MLLSYYRKKIASAKMSEKVLAGEMPFRWRTDLDYSWMGGWRKNQDGDSEPGSERTSERGSVHGAERNLIVVIPGRNRREAVIMADHYDTAYMDTQRTRCGAQFNGGDSRPQSPRSRHHGRSL